MRDLEAEMLKQLDGKFFWEHTTVPKDSDNDYTTRIRVAQREHAGKVIHVVPALESKGRTVNVNSIKPMTRVLKGEERRIEPILKAISEVYDVAIDDILGRSHSSAFAKAKHHLCWALFRYIPGMTFVEAGRLLHKNHSTIMYGRDKFLANMDLEKVGMVDKIMGYTG